MVRRRQNEPRVIPVAGASADMPVILPQRRPELLFRGAAFHVVDTPRPAGSPSHPGGCARAREEQTEWGS